MTLEDHSDVTLLWWNTLRVLSSDRNCSVPHFLQTGNESQCSRFAASGRTDEGEQLLIFNGQADAIDSANGLPVGCAKVLCDILKFNASHARALLTAAEQMAMKAIDATVRFSP